MKVYVSKHSRMYRNKSSSWPLISSFLKGVCGGSHSGKRQLPYRTSRMYSAGIRNMAQRLSYVLYYPVHLYVYMCVCVCVFCFNEKGYKCDVGYLLKHWFLASSFSTGLWRLHIGKKYFCVNK